MRGELRGGKFQTHVGSLGLLREKLAERLDGPLKVIMLGQTTVIPEQPLVACSQRVGLGEILFDVLHLSAAPGEMGEAGPRLGALRIILCQLFEALLSLVWLSGLIAEVGARQLDIEGRCRFGQQRRLFAGQLGGNGDTAEATTE